MTLRLALALTLFAVACDKNASDPNPSQPAVVARPPSDSPDTTANPHAGGDNPHAGGLPTGDTSGTMPQDSIHQGIQGQMPSEPFDPAMSLDGTIDVAPALKAQVKSGDILFLFAKKVDEQGNPTGGPLAVDRLDVAALPAKFHLDGGNIMVPGTKLEGTVMLFARIDRDGEARSRNPGDLEGTLKAAVPGKDLKIVLDTPVQ